MMKKLVFITVISFIVVLSLMVNTPGYAEEVPGVSKDTVKIGLINDLTGPAADMAAYISKATRVLFNYTNDNGGIHGRKLRVFEEDAQFSPVKTIAAAKYLLTHHGVFCFVNTIGSTPNVALSPLIKKEKVPNVAPTSQSSQMYKPFNKYIFPLLYGGEDGSIIAMDFIMNDLKAKNPRIAIIYQEDEMGKDLFRGIKKATKAYGVELVAAESYKRGAIDMSSQVLNLKRAKPDYVYVNAFTRQFAALLKESKQFGFHPRFYAGVVAVPKVIALAGDAYPDDMLSDSFRAQVSENVPGMIELKEIMSKYSPMTEIDPLLILGWTHAMVLIEGLKRAGKDLTRESLVDALETFRDWKTGDLTCPVTYTSTSHKGGGAAKIYKVDKEKKIPIPITGWRWPSIK